MSEELRIYVGSRVTIFGKWHQPTDITKIPDATDPFADPSALSFRVYRPDDDVDEFVYGVDTEIVRDSVGNYHCSYLVPLDGAFGWAWLPTGNAAQPSTGKFYAHSLGG